MAIAYVELPPGWGPGRIIQTRCKNLGYGHDVLSRGHGFTGDERWVLLDGHWPGHVTGLDE